jgi:hypothetical protein
MLPLLAFKGDTVIHFNSKWHGLNKAMAFFNWKARQKLKDREK